MELKNYSFDRKIKTPFCTMVLVVLLFASVGFAQHNSGVELQPEWSAAGMNMGYTVEICNVPDGNDSIDEVRIYNNPNYVNFDADDKTGWYKAPYNPVKGHYEYTATAPGYYIAQGTCTNFTFSATTPPSGPGYCNLTWQFETRDITDLWIFAYDNTSVDDLAPNITKKIIGNQSGPCPPGSGEECWIRQDTEIQIDIVEAGLCGVSGLDFCEVSYTLDGSAPIPVIYADLDGESSWNYSMTFDNDSLHVLNVTCKDIAGNVLEDIEVFRVDDTPPETTKTYGDPHFPYTIVEDQYPHWITTHTLVTLSAVDPDPTTQGCNISNMTTYYRNVYEGPQGLLGFCEDYNVCMTWNSSGWDDCGWIEYTGPFFKNEESCHIIEYYSVDELGNREPVKHQCVYVEDTPPVGTKEVGVPNIPCSKDESITGEDLILILENKNSTWQPITGDGIQATLEYNDMGPEFEYELTANGLQTNTEYSLIYYADEPDRFNNWGGDNPGALIVEATSDSNGNLVVSGSVDLGMNLPSYPDANMDINEHDYCGAPDFYSHCTGAKIWLVPSSDYSEPGLTAWNPNNYLFETDLIDYNFAECYWVRDHVTEINLSCMDPQPHPVGYGEACFRISFDIAPWLTNRVYCPLLGGTMQGPNDDDYCCVDEGTIIIFQEDSLHGLEFYCVDALENRNNQTDLEYFRVDSIPPIINKTLIGPQYGDCPPRPGTNDTCWIKDWTCEENGTGTTIHVEAYDNNTYENCTVGNVTCDWMYYLDGNPMKGESNKIPPFDIRFYEDTVHELEIVCRDALGNNIEDIETFYVDSQPPLTNKTYGDPQKIEPNCEAMCISQCIGNPVCFEDCTHALCTIWINSSTPITLNATDNPQAPCASGVNNTYWRNTVVSDNYCYDVVTCDEAQGMGNWTEYTGQFYKPEESCHLIEYFSVDNLGIEEEIKKQCVFVDNTPPRGNKTVGEPKIACNGSEFNITTNGGMLAPRVQGINPVTLYVIADNSKQPNLLEAYNVETNGTLTYVSNYTLPTVGNGAVGTALDTVNDQLFVTFEFIGDVYVFDANNFNPMGNISTAASDLAGVFVDETQGYLYVADRNGPNVHVYDTTTHANVITYNTGLNIYGMAFDHNNNKIYVTDGSTTVREYNTTMNLLNTYSLPNNNVGIAVDTRNQADVYLYTTTWYYSPSSFTKYRINNGVSNQSATMDDPAGIAVHPTAAFTYVTSGDPGLHDLKAYNTNTMTEIQNTIMPGTATDLFVGEVIFVPYCGDSKLDSGEECDDGNTENGDGCDENCQIEYPAGPDCWWVRDHVTEITLDCEDQGDHPVEQETMCYRVSYDNVSGIWGYITNQYCTEFGGTMEGDWCCNYVGDEPYVFNFTEDSVHDLEFYCIDHLGNTEETTDLEYFKVDSVAPNTTKTYLEPYYVNPQTGFDYIDNASRIELTAVDGGDVCHVDGIDTYYSYTKVRDYMCENNCSAMHGHEDINNTYTEPFGIPEESCHLIEFYSQDALGNTEDVQYQCVFVDHTPPVTNKTYSAPFFEEEGTKWITNMTNITLFAYDSEPHPSGVNRTYYRDVYLENETDWHYCYDNCSEWTQDARYGLPTAPEPYNPTGYKYTGLEESCHIIEYYSVDNVNKTETLNHQCVFVDNTAPIPDKKVGKPNSYCDNISGNCTWEWKVTTMTPIILSCDDQGPHPSDHSIVHWRVWWDRTQNWTEWNTTTEGTEIYLEEECLHQLEFYCTDAVGHESEKDLEWIKVEGGAFNITLNPKWNLISVPFVMTEDSIEEVFEDIADKVISVWTYDGVADEWYVYTPGPGTDTLTEMKPGWGYWVLMNTSAMEGNSVQLTIGGRLFSEAATPPSKKVVPGWNLIGYYGTDGELGYYGPNENGDPTYCALYSLIDTVIGNPRWSSLVTYWGPNNPPWKYMYAKNNMDAGAGYWMEIDVEDTYSFSTFCGRFSP